MRPVPYLLTQTRILKRTRNKRAAGILGSVTGVEVVVVVDYSVASGTTVYLRLD